MFIFFDVTNEISNVETQAFINSYDIITISLRCQNILVRT